MRNSVLMTVYNRDHLVLENVLRAISKNDLRDTEVLMIDDGSTEDYTYLVENFLSIPWFKIIHVNTLKDRPGTYNIDGFNNPSYAWNCAIEAAQGERLTFLSSDCIIQPDALKKARASGDCLWMSRVVDMDSGNEMTGKKRVFPMGFLQSVPRKFVEPYDENYLKGFDYDDNDFTASLALATGVLKIDLSCTTYHQSHKRKYYTDGLKGTTTNQRYCEEKWGGIPWMRDANDPLKIRQRQSGGELILTVTRSKVTQEELTG